MKGAESYKNIDDMPATLSVDDVAKALNISRAQAYITVNEEGFPKIKIGRRLLVPKQAFLNWVSQQLNNKPA